jgi:hypothetical protein
MESTNIQNPEKGKGKNKRGKNKNRNDKNDRNNENGEQKPRVENYYVAQNIKNEKFEFYYKVIFNNSGSTCEIFRK